jgi:RND family efflux transporter MFP subunit
MTTDDQTPRPEATTSAGGRTRLPTIARVTIQTVAPILILAAAAYCAQQMMESAPQAKRHPPARSARLVEVTPATTTQESIVVEAMGTVIAAREVELRPQVSGVITSIDEALAPGGRLGADAPLLRIDSRDYDLALTQRECDVDEATAQVTTAESSLADAEAMLRIERGNRTVAEREYELLEEEIPDDQRDLILREPQLASARASVKSAEASLQSAKALLRAAESQRDRAKLDLERTSIVAPFNAIVQAKHADVGQYVNSSTTLASLIGTDTYWIRVSIPTRDLRWVKFPAPEGGAGSEVLVHHDAAWGSKVTRQGHVSRLAPDVDPEGRMARLIVTVDDPLALDAKNAGKPPLLIGTVVRVEIMGTDLSDVVAIPRDMVRDGSNVWIMRDDDTLEVRPIEPIYRGRDAVLVRGDVRVGERLVTTDLAAAVDGMALRLDGGGGESRGAAGASGGGKQREEGRP